MFERSTVHNTNQQQAVAVEITLDDGRMLKGKLIMAASKSLSDMLNSMGSFIEFEVFGGDREFLAKSSLRTVKPIRLPGNRPLQSVPKEQSDFEPYAVLGLRKGASSEELRNAYHQLSKTYHPDRYANVDLPQEVCEYLQSMARRINSAYGILQAGQAQTKRFAKLRTEPIFQSGQPL